MLGSTKGFRAPPEAPVFEPNAKEFADPLAYIARIRPLAEKTGICKIRPPPDWQPPFAIDVDNFRFTPRVQCLRELEATTRVKLNFLEKLGKFWEYQGIPLKIPQVDKKILDLHSLFKIVHGEGGFERVSREKKWPRIAEALGYHNNPGNTLRLHYEKLLYPYDMFEDGLKLCNQKTKKEEVKVKKEDVHGEKEQCSSASHSLGGRCAGRMSRSVPKDEGIDYHANSELRKLQFFGAGPKAAIPVYAKEENEGQAEVRWKMRDRGHGKSKYMENDVCQICEKSDNENLLLQCEGCNEYMHMYCLVSPLVEAPKTDWRCPKCIAKECNAPREAYGFAQSKKTYTLHEFGEMADQFKTDYFHMPGHEVPPSVVEKEFWRLVSSIDEDVSVQYGADIHALTNGSGFPTDAASSDPAVLEYVKSGWNLNNLPVLEESVLRWVTGDVSGMKVPWCYVGMCFSSFAWHIEDHWTYSINYLHWGEPKTWYGASSEHAEQLEAEMKGCAPELFEQAPDLLHQLTTLMNPNVLMERGIPIVRTNQNAGEFVVTFPRSYHAGFNQGYNFAEAVNFCPADWLPYGQGCIENYKLVRRQCVFSHDELICKMAADPDRLNLHLAAETYKELARIVENEKKQRKLMTDKGVLEYEREAFELVPDDERQCMCCQTTCFLSAVTCACKPGILVCVAHANELCDCHPKNLCLRYRYSLDELSTMLSRLNSRARSYDVWSQRATSALSMAADCKLPLADFKDLFSEWTEKKLPHSPLLSLLSSAIKEAELCANNASVFLGNKALASSPEEVDLCSCPTYDDLHNLHQQMSRLHCRIKETGQVNAILRQANNLQEQIRFVISDDAVLQQPETSLAKLGKLLKSGYSLGINMPELDQLEQVIKQVKWMTAVKPLLSANQECLGKASASLVKLHQLSDEGARLAANAAVSKVLSNLQRLLSRSVHCEGKALAYLQSKAKNKLAELDTFIKDCQQLPVQLPNVLALVKVVEKARAWISRAAEPKPFLSFMKALVLEGQQMPVQLAILPKLENTLQNAQAWTEKASRAFLRKHSKARLLEVLQPRKDLTSKISRADCKFGPTDPDEIAPACGDIRMEEQDSSTVTAAYALSEQKEIKAVLQLRALNISKQLNCQSECGDSSLAGSDRHHDALCGQWNRCALCLEYTKGSSIITADKDMRCPDDGNTIAAGEHKTSGRILCSSCLRTKRPRVDAVLKHLLLPLHALKPIRVPEGEALSSLVDRALAWQKRAQQWLTANCPNAGDMQGTLPAVDVTFARASNFHELEMLVVEGNLIEMTLPEQDVLWELFSQIKRSKSTLPTTVCAVQSDFYWAGEAGEEERKRKSDCPVFDPVESSSQSLPQDFKRPKLENTDRQADAVELLQYQPSPSVHSTVCQQPIMAVGQSASKA